jgi:hypothetical protein
LAQGGESRRRHENPPGIFPHVGSTPTARTKPLRSKLQSRIKISEKVWEFHPMREFQLLLK